LKNPRTGKKGYGDMVNLKQGKETTLRRASPLMLKILQVDNQYEGLFIVAKSTTFMPQNSRIDFHGISVQFPQNIWKAIDEFINTLKNKSIIKEIL
jgi:hypothetical protein